MDELLVNFHMEMAVYLRDENMSHTIESWLNSLPQKIGRGVAMEKGEDDLLLGTISNTFRIYSLPNGESNEN